jgi:hypothetical protein
MHTDRADCVSFQPLEPRTLLSGHAVAASAPVRPLRSSTVLTFPHDRNYPDGGILGAAPAYSAVDYRYFDLATPKHVTIVAYGSTDYHPDTPAPVVELIQDKNANSIVDPGEVLVVANNGIALARTLGAGRWYLRITPPAAGINYLPYEITNALADPIQAPSTFRKSAFWSQSQQVDASTTTPIVGEYSNTIDVDASHYYAVKFTHRAGLRVTLDQLYANADLQLVQDLNGNGRLDKSDILISSNRTRTRGDYFSASLDPGTYLVRVFSTTAVTPYHLHFSAVTSPATDPGSSMATAFDLGAFDGGANHPQTYMRSMAGGNRRDYYKVTLAPLGGLEVTLDSLSGDVDVQLIHDTNGNGLPDIGETIDHSSNPGPATDVMLDFPAAGVYFIRIYRASDGLATYQMSID